MFVNSHPKNKHYLIYSFCHWIFPFSLQLSSRTAMVILFWSLHLNDHASEISGPLIVYVHLQTMNTENEIANQCRLWALGSGLWISSMLTIWFIQWIDNYSLLTLQFNRDFNSISQFSADYKFTVPISILSVAHCNWSGFRYNSFYVFVWP